MDVPAAQRRFAPAVIARLFREPQRFAYFQALRLIELWLKRRGAPRADLVAHYLRFENSTSLAFPASQIEAIAPDPPTIERDATALDAALREARLDAIRMTPSFMGLLGAHGALPAHYTERIAMHAAQEQDAGPRAFLDVFASRSLALFYAAWRKYRLPLAYELDGADAFLPLLLSLAGLGHPALRQRLADDAGGAVRDESLAYFAAALQQRPVSATQIARVLSAYFGQPITAQQFVGHWYAVPPAQQTMLGDGNAVLGTGALAGARVWQRDLRVRLVVGPLDRAGFAAFLPGERAARALGSLLTLFTGLALEYEVRLVLRAADVEGVTLAGAGTAAQLGWNTYLVTGPQHDDRGDVHYELCAL